jgi:hypothetical protein
MNGNHDKNAIGEKIIIPIPASYILANSRTESHKPSLYNIPFHVIANCNSRTLYKMLEVVINFNC